MTVPGNSPLNYPINTQPSIRRITQLRPPNSSDYKNFREGDEWLDKSSSDWYKLASINGMIATWVKIGGTGGPVESFIPDSGTSPVEPNASNQITMTGRNGFQVVGGTNTLFFEPGASLYPITPFVVGPIGKAGYQTIQSAIDAAIASVAEYPVSAAIFVQPGTYTEDLDFSGCTVFSVGLTLVGATALGDEGQCEIIGTHIPPLSGTLIFRNFKLSHATSIFSSALPGTTHFVVIDAELNITNGYSFNLINWNGIFEFFDINPGTLEDGLINNTGGSTLFSFSTGLGSGTTNPMILSGTCVCGEVDFTCPVNFTTGSNFDLSVVQFYQPVTFSSDSTGDVNFGLFIGGATPAITMDSSQPVQLFNCVVSSSNNPSINGTGSGILDLITITFTDNSSIAPTLTIGSSGVTLSNSFQTSNAASGVLIDSNSIQSVGSNANINLDLSCKGTGNINVTSPTGKIINITTDQDQDFITGTGKMNVNNAFKLPSVDGTAGQVLTTDGAGTTSWGSNTPSGSALQFIYQIGNVVSTTTQFATPAGTPQLANFDDTGITINITPNNANNLLNFNFTSYQGVTANPGSSEIQIAVFKNGGTNAVYANLLPRAYTGQGPGTDSLEFVLIAGDTNPQSYNFRFNITPSGTGGTVGTLGLASVFGAANGTLPIVSCTEYSA